MIYTCTVDTPLGAMTAAAKDEGLTGLWFIGQRHYPSQTAEWIHEPGHPVFVSIRDYLTQYFSGDAAAFGVRLVPHGSAFQRAVWNVLLTIPVGHVATYGQIATYLARTSDLTSMSAQAVGGAVGHNPISILIPCHRVVGFQGALTGYAGGLNRKAALLRIEKVDLTGSGLVRSTHMSGQLPLMERPCLGK